jgi:hypothetical protein
MLVNFPDLLLSNAGDLGLLFGEGALLRLALLPAFFLSARIADLGAPFDYAAGKNSFPWVGEYSMTWRGMIFLRGRRVPVVDDNRIGWRKYEGLKGHGRPLLVDVPGVREAPQGSHTLDALVAPHRTWKPSAEQMVRFVNYLPALARSHGNARVGHLRAYGKRHRPASRSGMIAAS